MTKTAAKKLIGTALTTEAGTGTVTDAFTSRGQTWITVSIEGGGFNGSLLKTAIAV